MRLQAEQGWFGQTVEPEGVRAAASRRTRDARGEESGLMELRCDECESKIGEVVEGRLRLTVRHHGDQHTTEFGLLSLIEAILDREPDHARAIAIEALVRIGQKETA